MRLASRWTPESRSSSHNHGSSSQVSVGPRTEGLQWHQPCTSPRHDGQHQFRAPIHYKRGTLVAFSGFYGTTPHGQLVVGGFGCGEVDGGLTGDRFGYTR